MEGVEVTCFEDIYRNKKVFITGHTGFKGTWLALWLTKLGAKVAGYSLPFDSQSQHYEKLNLPVKNFFNDINHFEHLAAAIEETQPDIVFHLAAQPLVRKSYLDPIYTFQTNVLGSLHVYQACLKTNSVRALISITTDKVYQNNEWLWGYREIDRLGGNDPYSASKACVEILTESFRKSFLNNNNFLLATARAGNVIGGGDWSEDRLIPDLMRAYRAKQILKVRNPKAIRPWQHVLEPIAGYLLLGQKLLQGKSEFATAWNFGPRNEDALSVEEVLEKAKKHLSDISVAYEKSSLHEAQLLKLDSSKAQTELHWQHIWTVDEAIHKTISWYRTFIDEGRVISKQQLFDYIHNAQQKKVVWLK